MPDLWEQLAVGGPISVLVAAALWYINRERVSYVKKLEAATAARLEDAALYATRLVDFTEASAKYRKKYEESRERDRQVTRRLVRTLERIRVVDARSLRPASPDSSDDWEFDRPSREPERPNPPPLPTSKGAYSLTHEQLMRSLKDGGKK